MNQWKSFNFVILFGWLELRVLAYWSSHGKQKHARFLFYIWKKKKKSAFKDRLVEFNWGRGKACVVSGISPDIQVKVSAHQKYNRFSVTYLLWLCSRLFFPVMLLISRSASVLVHVISNTASITTTSQYLLVAHYATWPTVVKCLCSVSLLRGGGAFSRVISFWFYF